MKIISSPYKNNGHTSNSWNIPFLSVFLLIFPIARSGSDAEGLLKLKESFTNAGALDSWKPGTEPCRKEWVGIICENGIVSGIRLGNMGLSGKIDVDALMSISGLRSISIVSNEFSGPIPDLRRMGALRGLYLTSNQFSGEIPADFFSKMEGMKKVWLSGNKFSGHIPSSLSNLDSLMELHLENNHFSGPIPPLAQSSLNSLDFSHNNLTGEIPQSLSKFHADSFKGNDGLCGGSSGKPCAQPEPSNDINAKAAKLSVWVLVASAAVLSLMVVAICVMRRKQEKFDEMVTENLDETYSYRSSSAGKSRELDSNRKGIGSVHRAGSSRKGSSHGGKGVGDLVILNDERGEFGLSDLMKAAAEVLGNGGLGSSYKAMMVNGLTVVVKRIKEMSRMGRDQFDVEMRKFARLNHKNVLTPLAYHYRKDEKLLVSEFQPKGSLLLLLHGDRGMSHADLNWPVRLKIIQGIARGLGYLHTELSVLDLPHGDLKSSNVLLSPTYEPLLVDYGFCSLISGSQAVQALTAYKAPEAMLDHDISPKCDVYCLGIIILEILTGKFPSQYLSNGKGGTDLVQWVRSAILEGREVDLFDPDIVNTGESLGEMEQLLHIAAACTENSPDRRLDMREAIKRIETISVEGNYQDPKSIHVLPSLKDGYAEQPSEAVFNSLGHYGDQSGRRHDSVGDSGRRSFNFDMS